MEVQLVTGLVLKKDDGTEEAVKTASVRPGLEADEIAALMALPEGLNPVAARIIAAKTALAARTTVGGKQLTLDTWALLTPGDAARIRDAAHALDLVG